MRCVNQKAEAIRLRALYRRKAMHESTALPLSVLSGLIGPDCAYHLYRYQPGRRMPSR